MRNVISMQVSRIAASSNKLYIYNIYIQVDVRLHIAKGSREAKQQLSCDFPASPSLSTRNYIRSKRIILFSSSCYILMVISRLCCTVLPFIQVYKLFHWQKKKKSKLLSQVIKFAYILCHMRASNVTPRRDCDKIRALLPLLLLYVCTSATSLMASRERERISLTGAIMQQKFKCAWSLEAANFFKDRLLLLAILESHCTTI